MHSVTLSIAATMFATAAMAQTPHLIAEEMMVKSPDPGVEIYVRNKRPADMNSFWPERTLLFVHGATYPAHPGDKRSSPAGSTRGSIYFAITSCERDGLPGQARQ